MAQRAKSSSELKIFGTYRGDRHSGRGDVPAFGGKPIKPRNLDEEATKCWYANVPELVRLGVAKQIDTPLLTMMCHAWSHYVAASKIVAEKPTNRDARAAVSAYYKMFNDVVKRFGLSPADRQRLLIAPTAPTKTTLTDLARKRS